jgi:hypothetical protein
VKHVLGFCVHLDRELYLCQQFSDKFRRGRQQEEIKLEDISNLPPAKVTALATAAALAASDAHTAALLAESNPSGANLAAAVAAGLAAMKASAAASAAVAAADSATERQRPWACKEWSSKLSFRCVINVIELNYPW